ncbi:MAG: hypothetical protein ACFCUE_10420 [Candidatus Bathyarchaeia archaeon]|jgi:hypothetical protein
MEVLNRQMGDSINKIIDNVLTEVFGEKGAFYIYKYLENNYQLEPKQFSSQLELFSKGLEDCLSSGAIPVQTRILHTIGNI